MCNITKRERFEGCLIGGAAGDALGYPVEFMSYESIVDQFGGAGISGYWLQKTGGTALFSDDTQMTLFTAAGLVNAGHGATRAAYAQSVYRAYLDWLHTQTSWNQPARVTWLLDVPELHSRRAPGNTCLSALASGDMGTINHALNDSCGCGGVMRVAPVGLFFANPNAAVSAAADAAAITHSHPLGYISASGLAYIVNRCVYGEGESLSQIVDECIAALPVWFSDKPGAAERMVELLERAKELAAGEDPDAVNIPLLGEGWVGQEALAIAVYACLRHPDDFSGALIASVNHSGDADSTGAIAGNIMGAYLGIGAISAHWTADIELPEVLRRISDELYEASDAAQEG
jgi:ADP-ribosylglycohydrolase